MTKQEKIKKIFNILSTNRYELFDETMLMPFLSGDEDASSYEEILKEIEKLFNEILVKELTESVNVPSVLYHATYRPLLKSIKKHGLGGDKAQAKWEDSKPGVVYLALDPNVAESYAETSEAVPDEWLDEIVILKISTAGLDRSNLKIDDNVLDNEGDTLEYHGVIPANLVSL